MNKLLFLSFIFLCSCASVNTVKSSLETNDTANEHRYYDIESKIFYQIMNDEKNLHIKLNTSEFGTITKILKTGLTIYFDVKGKKNNNVYLQYPIAQKQHKLMRDKQKSKNDQPPKFNLKNILLKVSNEALFIDYEATEGFNILLSPDIKVSIKAISNSEISYNLIIPFNRITKEDFSSLSNLSIGIVSGKFNTPSMEGGSKPVSMSVGGRSRGRSKSGGMSGGRTPSGESKSGYMSDGGKSNSMNLLSMTTPIKLWLKIDLHDVE